MFEQYLRTNVAEMRPHIVGEDMAGISVQESQWGLTELPGGMIARNPKNHDDKWYVTEDYFKENFIKKESND